MRHITNYSELEKKYTFYKRVRSKLRDATVFLLSVPLRVDTSKEWIRFPFYHHVFDDERNNFERHLVYMKNYGDFISLDSAIEIFKQSKKIGGRYFCVSFDDGFKNCVTNALPLLKKHACYATFFLSVGCIGKVGDENKEIIEKFFNTPADAYSLPVEFMDWNDCRKLLHEGMSIGSHTYSHLLLKDNSKNKIREEMLRSKQIIEEKLGILCKHFCCPWGLPEKHFQIKVDPQIAKETGYFSFLTNMRGLNYEKTDPFFVKRDHLIAKWGIYQLKYFFSKA